MFLFSSFPQTHFRTLFCTLLVCAAIGNVAPSRAKDVQASSRKCELNQPEELTIKSFDRCSQVQLDAFYRDLNAGSIIPDGSFDGKVQLARPGSDGHFNIVKAIRNLLPNFVRESQEFFLERLWGGKTFIRKNKNEADLFNRIVDDLPLFPAHVYYGRSLFDSSRLSIVIDYSSNQDIAGYRDSIDWLVNEDGLAIRDEIRKVHDDLYLGRAYVRGKFLLNFILATAR